MRGRKPKCFGKWGDSEAVLNLTRFRLNPPGAGFDAEWYCMCVCSRSDECITDQMENVSKSLCPSNRFDNKQRVKCPYKSSGAKRTKSAQLCKNIHYTECRNLQPELQRKRWFRAHFRL